MKRIRKQHFMIAAGVLLIFLGTIYFHFSEGWDLLDSFLFCLGVLFTVAYSVFPVSLAGKLFLIFYLLVGIVIWAMFIKTIQSGSMKEIDKQTKK